MRSTVVNGEHLDVLVIAAAMGVFVLDAYVRKMDLVVEIGQAMFKRPRSDFFLISIGMPVVVVTIGVVLVQPPLIVALQLVIEDDAINASALVVEAVRGLEKGVVDL